MTIKILNVDSTILIPQQHCHPGIYLYIYSNSKLMTSADNFRCDHKKMFIVPSCPGHVSLSRDTDTC